MVSRNYPEDSTTIHMTAGSQRFIRINLSRDKKRKGLKRAKGVSQVLEASHSNTAELRKAEFKIVCVCVGGCPNYSGFLIASTV